LQFLLGSVKRWLDAAGGIEGGERRMYDSIYSKFEELYRILSQNEVFDSSFILRWFHAWIYHNFFQSYDTLID
jgi:hypothetical protein